MSDFDDWAEMWRRTERRLAEFERLAGDAPRTVGVGDRVLVAAGLLGRGHEWVRAEAHVLHTSESGVFVRFTRNRLDGTPDEEWIHPALVVAVLDKSSAAE
jgi:hypothetical protein